MCVEPSTAKVDSWVLMEGIEMQLDRGAPSSRCMHDGRNGIAWDAVGQRPLVSGKNWPMLYEMKLVEIPSDDRSLLRVRAQCMPQVFPL